MTWFKPTTLLDKFFEASVLIKGVEGVLETIAGIIILIAGSQGVASLAFKLAGQEVIESSDFLTNYLTHTGQHLASGGTTFLVAYLLVHGIIKLVAVYSLLRNQLWGYYFSMITLGTFMLYQIYQFGLNHSAFLAGLTIFDVFLMWLIYREYEKQKILKGKT